MNIALWIAQSLLAAIMMARRCAQSFCCRAIGLPRS